MPKQPVLTGDDSGDYTMDAQPSPPTLTADQKYGYDLQAWGFKQVIGQLRFNRVADKEDRKEHGQKLDAIKRELELVKAAVKDVDSAVEETAKAKPSNAVAKVISYLKSLPSAVQLTIIYFMIQWGSVLFEQITGHAPPQNTVPVSMEEMPAMPEAVPTE